jgi:hypothetical protein
VAGAQPDKGAEELMRTKKSRYAFDGISPGNRVQIIRGKWAGAEGVYAGGEQTPIGNLHRVNLDNGFSSLVQRQDMRRVN